VVSLKNPLPHPATGGIHNFFSAILEYEIYFVTELALTIPLMAKSQCH